MHPNTVKVEFTSSQIEYLEAWSRKLNGLQVDGILRMMVDTMIRTQPQLGKEDTGVKKRLTFDEAKTRQEN